ncbi:hypothetical protein CN993_00805 [Bacillus thuringiensis]|uniref:DUF4145 domain-containing protein n=1 Tax=Bacillus thuringiensis TaxID=1428 RepID=UPI000BFB6955|nr:DUF4145 domain-containing protein [Bacillus thuringiensis]PGP49041.1 hypothetical protein CN993_00805 [Bacillus thuringiensis]HDR7687588.1 DUF4145 domain-containing protein [Bacillus toyonensis]
MEIERFHSQVYCQNCKGTKYHGIIQRHIEVSKGYPYDFDWVTKYFILHCLGCDTVAFVKEYSDETMEAEDEYGNYEYFTDITVYPEEPNTSKKMKVNPHKERRFENAPDLIKMMYSQVVSAFNISSYLLSAVGLRMIIEGICKDLNIKDGYTLDSSGDKVRNKEGHEKRSTSLDGKINGLVEKGVIVKKQADIIHQIRKLGNSSAHDLEVPSKTTIMLALEIIENMIYNIYEIDKYTIM